MLNHRIGRISRDIAYRYPAALCRRYIDIVVARGKKPDITQIFAFFHYFVCYLRLIAYNGIAVGNDFGELIMRHGIIEADIAECLYRSKRYIARCYCASVKYGNFHLISSHQ